MKKILALIIIVSAFAGCRKGEDDPRLSLYTRKMRLTGEWKLTEGSSTWNSLNYSGTSSSFNNETLTESNYVQVSNSGSLSGPYSLKVTIDADGTFKSVETRGVSSGTLMTTTTTTGKGEWNFTGRVGEYKNKEQVIFRFSSIIEETRNSTSVSTITRTYSGSNMNSGSWTLQELRNNKIVVYSKDSFFKTGSHGTEELTMTLEK